MKLELYAIIFGYINVYGLNKALLYKKIRCAFNDESNEKVRELKIRKDKNGEYVIRKNKRYYID